jgi:hypothetical protein
MDHDAAVVAARELAKVAADHADAGEKLRRMPDPVVEAFVASGQAG